MVLPDENILSTPSELQPIDPAWQRYRRIAWFLVKSTLLITVFVASICLSPWLAAARRRHIVETTNATTELSSDYRLRRINRRILARPSAARRTGVQLDHVRFPIRAGDFARYSSAAVYAVDAAQSFFESDEFGVIDKIYLDGRTPEFDEILPEFNNCAYLAFADLRAVSSRNDLSALAEIETLEHVQFTHCDLDEHAIQHLAKLDRLRHIFFYACRLTSGGLRALQQCRQAHWMIVMGCDLNDRRMLPRDIHPLRSALPRTCVSFDKWPEAFAGLDTISHSH